MAPFIVQTIFILAVVATLPSWCYKLDLQDDEDYDMDIRKSEEFKSDLSDRNVHFSNYAHCVTEKARVDLNFLDEEYIHVPHMIHNVTCMSWNGAIFDPMSANILEDDHCYAYPKACTTVVETRTVFRRRKQGSDCWKPVPVTVASGCKCAILFSKTTE